MKQQYSHRAGFKCVPLSVYIHDGGGANLWPVAETLLGLNSGISCFMHLHMMK